MKRANVAVALVAVLLVCGAAAADYRLQSLRVEHPFARATPPGATSGGAYLTIENAGSTVATLVGATSPVAGSVELHQMAMNAGVMTMRGVPALQVGPGSKVELKPGGYHLMLLDLKQPLRVGDKFPLQLSFQNLGTMEISVEVEPMGAGSAMTHK